MYGMSGGLDQRREARLSNESCRDTKLGYMLSFGDLEHLLWNVEVIGKVGTRNSLCS